MGGAEHLARTAGGRWEVAAGRPGQVAEKASPLDSSLVPDIRWTVSRAGCTDCAAVAGMVALCRVLGFM